MTILLQTNRPFKIKGLRLPTTEFLNKVMLESIVDFMKSIKTTLNGDGIESALDEEKRVVEFIHKPWVKAACIRIKLNSSNYHDIIIKYSAQTSKPISPSTPCSPTFTCSAFRSSRKARRFTTSTAWSISDSRIPSSPASTFSRSPS